MKIVSFNYVPIKHYLNFSGVGYDMSLRRMFKHLSIIARPRDDMTHKKEEIFYL